MKLIEIAEEQVKPLGYKIDKARQVIQQGFSVSRFCPALAFSGGKDSTVLWHLIRTHFPEQSAHLKIIFGNTGVEYPESLQFARQLGRKWGGDGFFEARPGETEQPGYRYAAQRLILDYLIETGEVKKVLQEGGKLKTTDALERACPPRLREEFETPHPFIKWTWPEGTRKSFFWCVDQYGWPILGKAFSKLNARRINIDCFLRFSESKSEDPKLLAYYDVLREVKISQACCDILKKEPSERVQAGLKVDVMFKGLMAAESRTRQTNFATRGYLFESSRAYLSGNSFYHCNPLSIWTDDDIWTYIREYDVPYSPLYDMGYEDADGDCHCIKRNGCLGCCTDILYLNNHMSTLRHTHPKAWNTFMRMGMAEELRKLQQLRRNGQMSLMDYLPVEQLIEDRPCAFDSINKLILSEEEWEEPEDTENAD